MCGKTGASTGALVQAGHAAATRRLTGINGPAWAFRYGCRLTDMQRAGSGYGLFVHQRAGVMRVVATR
jgi:hypothetical protein